MIIVHYIFAASRNRNNYLDSLSENEIKYCASVNNFHNKKMNETFSNENLFYVFFYENDEKKFYLVAQGKTIGVYASASSINVDKSS